MFEQFLNHIERESLCTKNDRLLLAVSGGLDSMVMLRLFHAAGFSIGVAHANFQLRGAASDGDEKFVRDYCLRFNIPYFFRRFETNAYAEAHKLSVQMAARELRYVWFEELLVEENFRYLCTAHHLNDSVETMLFNWMNGAPMEGMLGVPAKNGNIIRPLLFATRSELEKFAREEHIVWREDSSNDTVDYRRNFIRHKIIPLFKEMNPSLEQTVSRGMDKLSADYALMSYAVREWQTRHVEHQGNRIMVSKKGLHLIHRPEMVLWRSVNQYGFGYDVCVQIISSMDRQPGSIFRAGHYELVVDRDVLIVYPKTSEWGAVEIQPGESLVTLGPLKLKLHKEKYIHQSFPIDDMSIMVPADAIRYPLQWRRWKPGDAFYPFGLGHRKKVSDLLTDKKVSRADKAFVTVLESNGDVVWVVGHRLDDRFKVRPSTKEVLVISVSREFD